METIDVRKQSISNRVADVRRQHRNKTDQLRLDEAQLAAVSRDLVAALGVLKRAEAAASKLGNGSADNRLSIARDEIAHLRQREEISGRIVLAGKKLLEEFLNEGTPSNLALLSAAKDYEEAENELARL